MNSSEVNTHAYAILAQQLLQNLVVKEGHEFQIQISEQSENEFTVRLQEKDENKKPPIKIKAGLYDLSW